MKSLSIRMKLVTLIVGPGIILGVLLAVYAANLARNMGEEIVRDDARLITHFLIEDLAVALDAFPTDQGLALKKALDLGRYDNEEYSSRLNGVAVFNKSMEYLDSYNIGPESPTEGKSVGNLTMEDRDEKLLIQAPIKNSRNDLLGYVVVDISKQSVLSQARRNSMISLAMGAILIIVISLLGVLYGSYIGKPISRMAAIARSIAKGNLNHEIDIKTGDEIGVLASSFKALIEYMQEMARGAEMIASRNLNVDIQPKSENDVLGNAFQRMIANLDDIIRELSDNAGRLASAASEMASSSDQMAAGSKSQTEQAIRISSAIEEMSATIMESSRNAREAREMAENTAQTSSEGRQVVGDTIQSLIKIASAAEQSGLVVNELAHASDRIGQIIGVIDDIADQTNLLALNAAIEAARAGEQGRGFAVVADEVRRLAERTGKATGKISEMIKDIQSDSDRAVKAMAGAGKLVDEGKAMADKAGNSLNKIYSMSQQVMDMIVLISTAANEQSIAAEQIAKNMEHISYVTRETATGAVQSAAAAEELSHQAESMQSMVTRFKIKEEA